MICDRWWTGSLNDISNALQAYTHVSEKTWILIWEDIDVFICIVNHFCRRMRHVGAIWRKRRKINTQISKSAKDEAKGRWLARFRLRVQIVWALHWKIFGVWSRKAPYIMDGWWNPSYRQVCQILSCLVSIKVEIEFGWFLFFVVCMKTFVSELHQWISRLTLTEKVYSAYKG